MSVITWFKNNSRYHIYSHLLLVFFVLHQWRFFFPIISCKIAIQTLLVLLIVDTIIFLVCKLILKSFWKATFLSFIILFFLLFTNTIITYLKLWQIIPRLDIQLFIAAIVSLFVLLVVMRIRQPGNLLPKFLNTTLLLLIVLETGMLLYEATYSYTPSKPSFVISNNKKSKIRMPSVYLILLDEYAGNETLKQNFNFDNSFFIKSLGDRQFRVIEQAKSNYRYTALSIPSMFNGEYITTPKGKNAFGEKAFKYGMIDMYNNRTYDLFRSLGYETFNYSPFNIQQNPAAYRNDFLPNGFFLLLYPTLLDDLANRLSLYLLTVVGGTERVESYYNKISDEQKKITNQVLNLSKQWQEKPVFCYLHLMLPHVPYLYDSTGNINIGYLSKRRHSIEEDKSAYIQSVIYANKLVTKMVDSIKLNTAGHAALIIMSDHGYKTHTFNQNEVDQYNTLNAIYYPTGKTTKWYNGMTNVNQFRILFSVITEEEISLEKDSIIIK